MGFEEKAIIRAIKRFPYDPDNMHRIEWLLSASAADETEAIAPENQTNEPCEASDFTGLFEGIVSNDEADASQSAEHKNKASTNKVRLYCPLHYCSVNLNIIGRKICLKRNIELSHGSYRDYLLGFNCSKHRLFPPKILQPTGLIGSLVTQSFNTMCTS